MADPTKSVFNGSERNSKQSYLEAKKQISNLLGTEIDSFISKLKIKLSKNDLLQLCKSLEVYADVSFRCYAGSKDNRGAYLAVLNFLQLESNLSKCTSFGQMCDFLNLLLRPDSKYFPDAKHENAFIKSTDLISNFFTLIDPKSNSAQINRMLNSLNIDKSLVFIAPENGETIYGRIRSTSNEKIIRDSMFVVYAKEFSYDHYLAVISHEYFHSIQSHLSTGGRDSITINSTKTHKDRSVSLPLWLIEGPAMFFTLQLFTLNNLDTSVKSLICDKNCDIYILFSELILFSLEKQILAEHKPYSQKKLYASSLSILFSAFISGDYRKVQSLCDSILGQGTFETLSSMPVMSKRTPHGEVQSQLDMIYNILITKMREHNLSVPEGQSRQTQPQKFQLRF